MLLAGVPRLRCFFYTSPNKRFKEHEMRKADKRSCGLGIGKIAVYKINGAHII